MAEFAGLEQHARIARKAHHIHEGTSFETEAAEAVLGLLGVAENVSMRNADFLMKTLVNANAFSNGERIAKIQKIAGRLRTRKGIPSVQEAA